jgi:hypothetical protein
MHADTWMDYSGIDGRSGPLGVWKPARESISGPWGEPALVGAFSESDKQASDFGATLGATLEILEYNSI